MYNNNMKFIKVKEEVHKRLMVMKHELSHSKVSDTIDYLMLEVKGELYGDKTSDASHSQEPKGGN